MLLKCSTLDKRGVTIPSKGKGKARSSVAMKMTHNTSTMLNNRIHHRKNIYVNRIATKRHPGKAVPSKLMSKYSPGKMTPGKKIILRPNPPPCDNSNDSGLGFDQHVEQQTQYQNAIGVRPVNSIRSPNQTLFNNNLNNNSTNVHSRRSIDDVDSETDRIISSCSNSNGSSTSNDSGGDAKRQKLNDNIDIDPDDACSNDAFVLVQRTKVETIPTTPSSSSPSSSCSSSLSTTTLQPAATASTSLKLLNSSLIRNTSRPHQKRIGAGGGTVTLQSQIGSMSRDGTVQLQIVEQPEQQHRARYQTEGSRGAVKDRTGHSFPVVRLAGYTKPTQLQVFIGTDVGRVTPHMFYQACKVSGKNSTQCEEKNMDGTMVIHIDLKPENEMTVTCDCVGILKERNVDVEHRFPEQSGPRSKKKSTRCRMVFRTQITNEDGSVETLQVCSQQIICTQPPGIPEICKKSLVSCPANGGLELFIIGKNFLKDTRVIFQGKTHGRNDMESPVWEDSVLPDKEYLQQTHLVCTVPSYFNPDISEPITVEIYVLSSNKKSEVHNFVYTPQGSHTVQSAATTNGTIQNLLQTQQQDVRYTSVDSGNNGSGMSLWNSNTIEPKSEIDSGMMPPPSGHLTVRRASSSTLITEQLGSLKSELLDENSQNSLVIDTVGSDSMDGRYPGSNENSVDATTMKEILYGPHKIHKSSLEIIDEDSNMSMVVTENTINVSPIPMNEFNGRHMMTSPQNSLQKEMEMNVKQEQQFAQIQGFVNNSQTHILPSISQLESSVNKLAGIANDNVVTLFNNGASNSTNVFGQQMITSSAANQPTFLESLCTEAAAKQLEQILDVNKMNGITSSPTNSIMSNSNHSPIEQDIILNSQSMVLNGSGNNNVNSNNTNSMSSVLSVTTSNSSQSSQHSMSPDIILNPSVSPTVMCQTSGDPSNILNQQVTLANSMLNGISLSQSTQDAILNNLNLIPSVMSQQTDPIPIQTKTSIAVKNMYLNAANEILTTQPTESTINALISMDQSMMNAHQSDNTQVTSMLLSQPTPSTSAQNSLQNIPMFTDTATQMMQQQQQQQQQNLAQSQNVMTLLNEAVNQVVNEQQMRCQEEFIRATNGAASLSHEISSLAQESHLQNLQLGRNVMASHEQKAVDVAQATANVVATAAIPQELTTMSDNDLISYINPSCFDQKHSEEVVSEIMNDDEVIFEINEVFEGDVVCEDEVTYESEVAYDDEVAYEDIQYLLPTSSESTFDIPTLARSAASTSSSSRSAIAPSTSSSRSAIALSTSSSSNKSSSNKPSSNNSSNRCAIVASTSSSSTSDVESIPPKRKKTSGKVSYSQALNEFAEVWAEKQEEKQNQFFDEMKKMEEAGQQRVSEIIKAENERSDAFMLNLMNVFMSAVQNRK